MPFMTKEQRRLHNEKKKRNATVKKHAYFEGHRQALMKLGLDAAGFAEFAEADDTEEMLPGTGDEELGEENPWLQANQELVNPQSPWAGAPLVQSENAADI